MLLIWQFLILVLSTKKQKCWNRLKFPLFVTCKHANLSNGGLFWKSILRVPFLEESMLFLWLYNEISKKNLCLDKSQPFILMSIWWVTFFKHRYYLTRDIKICRTRQIKWILTKYETWFDFFLVLFMTGYKWVKRHLEKSSFKANQVLHQLIFDVVRKVTLGGHLYPFINKAKKKSN